jgi:hypothetical protein
MNQAAEQLYRERQKRMSDAVQLKKPDRIPISLGLNYFPAKFTGTTTWAAYYDWPAWKEVYIKAAQEYQVDRLLVILNQSGAVLETLDIKQLRWPGHGVAKYHTHQFVEGEYMKQEEYDLLLNDPSDFLVRFYLPRVYGLLTPMGKLPPLNTLMNALPFNVLGTEEFAGMLETLARTAREAVEWQKQSFALATELANLGFFCPMTPLAGAPFDIISDYLRGMRGTMLDMYRCPDKLLRAVHMMTRITLERIAQWPVATEFLPIFMPLHRGAYGFMSLKQFEKFYWPTLKQVCEAMIARGYTPDLFFEGDYTSRLEYIAELPKGKAIARFDVCDLAKAKQILGGKVCIAGNMPVSVLQVGTPDDVKKIAKQLIDTAGKDGGYIMAPASALDEVNPDNMKVWIEVTKEYGKY